MPGWLLRPDVGDMLEAVAGRGAYAASPLAYLPSVMVVFV
jgi:hypothetical protein